MQYGELLVSNHASDPGVYIRTTANETLKLGPCHIGSLAPNTLDPERPYPEQYNQDLSKGELWLDNSGNINILKLWDGTKWIEAGRSLNDKSDLTSKNITIKPLLGQTDSLLSIFNNSNIKSVEVKTDGSTQFSKPVTFSEDTTFSDVTQFDATATFTSIVNVPDTSDNNDSSNRAANTRFVQSCLENAEITYTNPNGSFATVGGIEAGTTFDKVPISTVIQQLLNPYQNPVITLSPSIGSSRTIEVGEALLTSGTISFSTSITNNTNLKPGSIVYKFDNTIVSNPYTPSNYTTSPIKRVTPGSHTWSASGTNTKNSLVFSNSIIITWAYKIFIGWSTSDSLANTTTGFNPISIPNSYIKPTSVTKPETAAVAYIYIFLPTTYPPYLSFKSNNFPVLMDDTRQVSFNNINDVSVTYNVYRTENKTSGSLTIDLA